MFNSKSKNTLSVSEFINIIDNKNIENLLQLIECKEEEIEYNKQTYKNNYNSDIPELIKQTEKQLNFLNIKDKNFFNKFFVKHLTDYIKFDLSPDHFISKILKDCKNKDKNNNLNYNYLYFLVSKSLFSNTKKWFKNILFEKNEVIYSKNFKLSIQKTFSFFTKFLKKEKTFTLTGSLDFLTLNKTSNSYNIWEIKHVKEILNIYLIQSVLNSLLFDKEIKNNYIYSIIDNKIYKINCLNKTKFHELIISIYNKYLQKENRKKIWNTLKWIGLIIFGIVWLAFFVFKCILKFIFSFFDFSEDDEEDDQTKDNIEDEEENN